MRFPFFEFVVGFLDFGFADQVLLDLLHCAQISPWLFHSWREKVPFRRWVPSGRLAGPTEKPFLRPLAFI